MSAKRTYKGKAGDTGRLPAASRGRPSGGEGDTTGEKNSVPVGLIAMKPEGQTLCDAAGTPLFELCIFGDGTTYCEPSSDLAARIVRLGWKVGPEVQNLARGFHWLSKLQRDDFYNLWLDVLPCVQFSEQMIRLKGAFDPLIEHLGDELRDVCDETNPAKRRQQAAERLQKLLCGAVDALHLGAKAKPHGNTKQVLDTGDAVLPWEVIAIQALTKFVIEKRQVPNMTELRNEMGERLGVKVSHKRIGEVLVGIGVKLAKGPPIPKQEKGRLDKVQAKSGKRA